MILSWVNKVRSKTCKLLLQGSFRTIHDDTHQGPSKIRNDGMLLVSKSSCHREMSEYFWAEGDDLTLLPFYTWRRVVWYKRIHLSTADSAPNSTASHIWLKCPDLLRWMPVWQHKNDAREIVIEENRPLHWREVSWWRVYNCAVITRWEWERAEPRTAVWWYGEWRHLISLPSKATHFPSDTNAL